MRSLAVIAFTVIAIEPSTFQFTEHGFGDANGKPYEQLRRSLVSTGWTPSPRALHQNCDTYKELCETRPEMDYCHLTGWMPTCGWMWDKGRQTILVTTIYDADVVDGVTTIQ